MRSTPTATGVPVVLVLEPRSHLDLGDLPNLHAAELGVMTVRLERAIRSLDGVERVQVYRSGDEQAHLQVWCYARPVGAVAPQGWFLPMWNEILPAGSDAVWRENLALVAAWLAEFEGTAIAEPPRIDWQSLASLTAEDPSALEQPVPEHPLPEHPLLD